MRIYDILNFASSSLTTLNMVRFLRQALNIEYTKIYDVFTYEIEKATVFLALAYVFDEARVLARSRPLNSFTVKGVGQAEYRYRFNT